MGGPEVGGPEVSGPQAWEGGATGTGAARRRNTVLLVSAAATLCLLGAILAGRALTGGPADPSGVAAVGSGTAPTAAAGQPSDARAASPAAGPSPGAEGVVQFSSPTGNIGCVLAATGARCDVRDRDWQLPPRPPGCTLAWGQGVVLRPAEAGYACGGDSVLGAATVLEYGASAQRGTVRCASSPAGLRCEDTSTGHGFSVARAGAELH